MTMLTKLGCKVDILVQPAGRRSHRSISTRSQRRSVNRMAEASVNLELIFADDEPQPLSQQGRQIVSGFTDELGSLGVKTSQRHYMVDSATGGGGPLPSYAITLAIALAPQIVMLANSLIKSGFGRKYKIKIDGDAIEIEGTGKDDVLALLDAARKKIAEDGAPNT